MQLKTSDYFKACDVSLLERRSVFGSGHFRPRSHVSTTLLDFPTTNVIGANHHAARLLVVLLCGPLETSPSAGTSLIVHDAVILIDLIFAALITERELSDPVYDLQYDPTT
jgi:hypothetical protein